MDRPDTFWTRLIDRHFPTKSEREGEVSLPRLENAELKIPIGHFEAAPGSGCRCGCDDCVAAADAEPTQEEIDDARDARAEMRARFYGVK